MSLNESSIDMTIQTTYPSSSIVQSISKRSFLQFREIIRCFGLCFWSVLFIPLLASFPTQAHHVMGYELPNTWLSGLLSGLGHPIIGLDHFAFIVAVGLAAAAAGYLIRLPLAFITATVIGVLIHLMMVDLFFAEAIVAVSVLMAGSLLLFGYSMTMMRWLGLFVVGGLFHGYAYGEAIIGAESSIVIGYLIGFGMIQFIVSVGVAMLSRHTSARYSSTYSPTRRIAGGVVAGIGLVFLYTLIMPF